MFNLDVEEHNTEVDVGNIVEVSTEVVCRGCLKTGGEMKNIYEYDLVKDFFKYTGIPNTPFEGMPEHLCEQCEADLKHVKSFKDRCEESDKTMRAKIMAKKNSDTVNTRLRVKTLISNKKLLYFITAPNPNDRITLKCPNVACKAVYYKNNLLLAHLRKAHKISKDFELELRYFCTEKDCAYNIDLDEPKYFSGRKYLNQHYSKIHYEKIFSCESCSMKFAKLTDYHRHTKSCSLIYPCSACDQTYNSNEAYLVHLLRRHPDLHAKYKEEKKAQKRLPDTFVRQPEVIDNETPMKIRKDDISNEYEIKSAEEKCCEHNTCPASTSQFPPVQSSMDILLSAILADTNTVAYRQSLVETTSSKESVPEHIGEGLNEDTTVSEDYTTIEEESLEGTNTSNTENVQNTVDKHIDEETLETEAKKYVIDEPQSEETSTEMDTLKKTSGTQMPEDITSDISLISWPTKNDFDLQNEMSTQTRIEDWLLTGCEVFESVSLSDIETQTAPSDLGLSHKQTQSSTSQTQLPDQSIKETQTCVCLYDYSRQEVRNFDFTSSPNPSNLTSTETQTNDFVSSDVLLSFSSAQTQTNFEESGDNSM